MFFIYGVAGNELRSLNVPQQFITTYKDWSGNYS